MTVGRKVPRAAAEGEVFFAVAGDGAELRLQGHRRLKRLSEQRDSSGHCWLLICTEQHAARREADGAGRGRGRSRRRGGQALLVPEHRGDAAEETAGGQEHTLKA